MLCLHDTSFVARIFEITAPEIPMTILICLLDDKKHWECIDGIAHLYEEAGHVRFPDTQTKKACLREGAIAGVPVM